MANAAITPGDVPTPVKSRLSSLRRRMFMWLSVDGLTDLVLVALGLACLSYLVDRALWMDPAQRTLMLILIVGSLVGVVVWRLLRPMTDRPNDDALCLEVENAHKQLGESLISSVQFARMGHGGTGVSEHMVKATIDHGVQQSQQVNFADSLNVRQLYINLAVIAGTLVAGAGAFALQNQEDMKTWFDRNFALDHTVFWPQETYLVMKGNNLRGEQVTIEDKIRIARDDDWTLHVFVTPESNKDKIPDVVYIDIRTGSSRSTVKMDRVKDDEENEEADAVADPTPADADSEADKTDAPAPSVDVPPGPEDDETDAINTDESKVADNDESKTSDNDESKVANTDESKTSDTDESSEDTEHQEGDKEPEFLREFTFTFHHRTEDFRFRIRGNDHKSDWVEVELVDRPAVTKLDAVVTDPEYTGRGRRALPSGRGPHYAVAGSRMELSGESNKPLESGELTITANKDGFTKSLEIDGNNFSIMLSTEELLPGTYEIHLQDQEGLTSPRPTTFEIRRQEDRAPRVSAKLQGITSMVVPNARIPIKCLLDDDFRVTAARLSYQWNNDDDGETDSDDNIPLKSETLKKEIEALSNPIAFNDVWDLESLNLQPGSAFRFRVKADDNDDITTDKASGESTEFLLRIVTSEELRIDLLRRRKEIREEFERIRKDQDDLLLDTEALQADLTGKPDFSAKEKAELMRIQRKQKVVGTNVGNIELRLKKIVEEVKNNRLDEEPPTKKPDPSSDDPPLDDPADGEAEGCDDAVDDDTAEDTPAEDTPAEDDAPEEDEKVDPAKEDLGAKLTKQLVPLLENISKRQVIAAVRDLDQSRAAESGDVRDERLNAAAAQQRVILAEMDKVLAIMVKVEDYQEALNLLYEIEKHEKDVLNKTKEAQEEDEAKIFGDRRKKKPEPEDKKKDDDSATKTDDPTPESDDSPSETPE